MTSSAPDRRSQRSCTRADHAGVDVPSPRTVGAWLVLGMVAVEQVPWWAAHWLAEGHGGQTLAELAGLGAADSHAIHDLLPVALEEVGVPLPFTDVAAATEVFDHIAGMWRRGQVGERWVAQKVDEIAARADYSHEVLDLPLGHLYGVEDAWEGSWGPQADELTASVRAACLKQLAA